MACHNTTGCVIREIGEILKGSEIKFSEAYMNTIHVEQKRILEGAES